jgi:hypothetical protein
VILIFLIAVVLAFVAYNVVTSVTPPTTGILSPVGGAAPSVSISSPLDIVSGGGMVPLAVLNWSDLAQKYARINKILDPEEILAIIWNESTGNPNAQNPGDPSWGLMGVTSLIGETYGGITETVQLFEPDTNIKAGSAFLALLKYKYSYAADWPDAYNIGETKFKIGIRSPGPGNYQRAFFSHLADLKGGVL